MQRFRPLLMIALAVLTAGRPVAQGTLDDRVDRALRGLRTPVAVAGRPAVKWPIGERMAAYHVPGASVAIVDRGRILWAGGFGVQEAGAESPVTTSTLFQAQSISKSLTAAAALILVDDRRLSLDAPINTYLNSWMLPDNAFQAQEKVTVRRLLSHSAGVTVGGFAGYKSSDPLPTIAQILDGTRPANNPPIRVDTVPGSQSRYSGGGMMVLQQALVDVTGESFPTLMRRLVLDPAGMTLSSYEQPLSDSRQLEAASGHDAAGMIVEGKRPVQPELAAGGLWSTPTELARWMIMTTQSWQGVSDGLLSRATAVDMLSVQKAPFGLGVYVEGANEELNFSHAGSIWGFRARFIMFPATGQGAVVMANGDGGDALIGEALTAIASEFGWPKGGQSTREAVMLTAQQLDALVGKYTLPPAPSGMPVYFAVSRQGNQLLAELNGLGVRPALQLFAASADEFFSVEGQSFSFVRDSSGRAITIRTGGIEGARQP